MRTINRGVATLLVASGLLGLQIGCVSGADRMGQGWASSTPGAPAISSFVANPAILTLGSTCRLTGVFTAGTGVITPGNLPVTSSGGVDVTPAATTVYTLTVTNPVGVLVYQTASVVVTPALLQEISTDGVQASGAEQTSAGGSFTNGAIVGETFPATVSSASGQAIQVRDDFLPPDPAPPN